MQYFQIFDTDMYELSMTTSGIFNGDAEDIVSFECYFRHPKPIFGSSPYYFSGREKIIQLMENVKKELQDPKIGETFLELIKHKIPVDKMSEFETKIADFFKNCNKSFEYSVYPEGEVLDPYVPAVQVRGPKFIGMLLETHVMATVNGPTGLETQKRIGHFKNIDLLETLVLSEDPINENSLSEYFEQMSVQARCYREASIDKTLLDASFRRSPSVQVAMEATNIAMDNGYDGSANCGAAMRGMTPIEKINGTQAHLNIMSQAYLGENHEIESFRKWDNVWQHSTMLVDTYDTEKSVKMLIENNIKPMMVRIDSSPLDKLSFQVRKIFDDAGGNDVGIFISGDLTPSIISRYIAAGVPFDALMSGTKMVGVGIGEYVNSGFVYKVVEVEKNGAKYYPEKKANGKGSISGLKKVWRENGKVAVDNRPKDGEWGIFL